MFKKLSLSTVLFVLLVLNLSFRIPKAAAVRYSDEGNTSSSISRTTFCPSFDSLLAAANNDADPTQWEAITRLWEVEGDQIAQNHPLVRPILLRIAQNFDDIHQWKSIDFLWDSDDGQELQNRSDLASTLLQLASDPESATANKAAIFLWNSEDDQQPHYRFFFRPGFLEIAQDPQNADQWDMIEILWNSCDELEGENRALLAHNVQLIANDAGHPHHNHAINLCRADL